MKYAAYFTKNLTTHQLLEFDEIFIHYQDDLQALNEFCAEHQSQRIIVIIDDVEECIKKNVIKKLNVFHQTYPQFNLAIQLCPQQRFNEKIFKEACRAQLDVQSKLPIFFGMLASSFEELEALTAFYSSDIFITEDLCFDLARVRHVCGDRVIIHAIANVAQSKLRSTLPILKFFIRPEDIDIYGKIIDVIEFWGPADRQHTLLNIYKGGTWYGDLKDLIIDLNGSLESRRIIPNFAFVRSSCERRCMKGDACRYCYHVENIGESLKKKDLIIADK